ncbi:hypothetical protein SCACP_21210 [Sporomusa carbonis]|uniref:diversity-generating retroelement protein Avd n=1 Tax=Sporomusa carbonis TaxID=3076075 RepID=UPI003A5DC70D
MSELAILQKTYDMLHYLHESIRQYPKSERHTLAADTKQAATELLKLFITANKRYHKKTTLQDADIQLEILRYHIRLGYDFKFLPINRYENLARMLSEIGRMLGGWIKAFKV